MARQRDSTVPYADAVWEDAGDLRILVVDQDDAARRDAVAVLERLGYKVACAADRGSAARLLTRLEPAVVVADLETLAPDFEPLGTALEELFLEHAPCPVILLGTSKPREQTEWIKAAVPKPLVFGTIEKLVAAVEAITQPPPSV
jgi:CheY-like chemotaxis protein